MHNTTPLSQKTTLYKTAYQLAVVAKAPFTIHDASGVHIFTPPPTLRLMSSFFREYQCLPNCAGCCPYFTLEILPQEVDAFNKAYPGYTILTRLFKVDDRICSICIIDAGKQHISKRDFCGSLETQHNQPTPYGGCRIYDHRPFSCHIEPIKIHVVKDIGYIHKRPFGRGWAMQRLTGDYGALCEFETANPTTLTEGAYKQGIKNDLPVLYRMLHWADAFGIQTHLEKVIVQVTQKLESGNTETVVIA